MAEKKDKQNLISERQRQDFLDRLEKNGSGLVLEPYQHDEGEKSSFRVWDGGSLVRAGRRATGPKTAHGLAPRGKISHFSRAARRRMLYLLSTIKQKKEVIFITFTYPIEAAPTAETWQIHWKRFQMRLKRKHPGISGVWKREFTKRGVLHIHMLTWGISYRRLREFVPQAWYESVGSKLEKHLRAGTSVEHPREKDMVKWYISKYVAKTDEHQKNDNWGRHWGVIGRTHLPIAEEIEIEITDAVAIKMIRYARRAIKARPRSYKSLTVITRDPNQWAKLLAYTISQESEHSEG